MRKLPIRWRVTAAFAAASAVVLAAVGLFLNRQFEARLDQTLERGLWARSAEIVPLVAQVERSLSTSPNPTLEADESIAQILSSNGTVVAASAYGDVRLLTEDQLRSAVRGPVLADRPGDQALDESIRLLAVPVPVGDVVRVVVVGTSLDERNEALSALLTLEIIGFALALTSSSVVGYLVTGLALRPVEALRQRAETITADELADLDGSALPQPPVDDELGRLAATLNSMLQRIRSAHQAEQRAIEKDRAFVADASHQLRTPLTIIKSEVELALLTPNDLGSLHAAVVSAGEEADRLTKLVDDLLILAAADENRLALNLAPLDGAKMLESVAARTAQRVEAAGRTISVHASGSAALAQHLPMIEADRSRLELALTNLIDNALIHGDGAIELTAETRLDHVRISVRDHGPGFPEGLDGHAFERFRRGTAGPGGTGLGLAIVKAIIEAHDGRVEADNAHPGAVVSLTLPATGEPLRPEPASLPSASDPSAADARTGP